MACFAGLAVILTALGLYGVVSYTVAQRTHEIGIRMALGAQGESVQRIFVSRGLTLAAMGLALGLTGAAALMRLLSSFLFGVNPFDPATYVSVAAGLGLVALIATWLPARQATRIDPMLALRAE